MQTALSLVVGLCIAMGPQITCDFGIRQELRKHLMSPDAKKYQERSGNIARLLQRSRKKLLTLLDALSSFTPSPPFAVQILKTGYVWTGGLVCFDVWISRCGSCGRVCVWKRMTNLGHQWVWFKKPPLGIFKNHHFLNIFLIIFVYSCAQFWCFTNNQRLFRLPFSTNLFGWRFGDERSYCSFF